MAPAVWEPWSNLQVNFYTPLWSGAAPAPLCWQRGLPGRLPRGRPLCDHVRHPEHLPLYVRRSWFPGERLLLLQAPSLLQRSIWQRISPVFRLTFISWAIYTICSSRKQCSVPSTWFHPWFSNLDGWHLILGVEYELSLLGSRQHAGLGCGRSLVVAYPVVSVGTNCTTLVPSLSFPPSSRIS